MQDFSLIDKFKILMNVIVSSPFYIGLIVALLVMLGLYIYSIKSRRVISKWIYISIWLTFIAIIIVIYHEFFLELLDNLFDTVFMSLYFPNLSTYIITLIVSNYFFVYSVFSKEMKKPFKVINILNTALMDLLLIFIIGIVTKNNINVYDELTVYSNSNLLVLLEINSALFTSWLLLNLFIQAYYKTKKYDKVKESKTIALEEPQTPEIIFDWIES